MENTMINRIIPLIILLVAGCAPAYIHTTRNVLDTNPQGATIICDGRDAGYAPIVFNTIKNIDFIGENRAFTEEDIAKIMEAEKINQGKLKLGENIVLTDEEAISWIRWAEVAKIMNGELNVGETTFLTNEQVKAVMEATKIVDGELSIGEYTASIDAKEMHDTIQLVKEIEEYNSTCTAYWSSGVSKKYPSVIPFTYAGNGKLIHTLQRPEGEGYSQDAEFALKVKQLNQDQNNANRDASIAISAVQAQKRAAQAQERAAAAQERQSNKTTICSTTLGITTCY